MRQLLYIYHYNYMIVVIKWGKERAQNKDLSIMNNHQLIDLVLIMKNNLLTFRTRRAHYKKEPIDFSNATRTL